MKKSNVLSALACCAVAAMALTLTGCCDQKKCDQKCCDKDAAQCKDKAALGDKACPAGCMCDKCKAARAKGEIK